MKTMKILRLTFAFAALLAVSGVAPTSAENIRKARATLTSCADGSTVGSVSLIELPSSEGIKVVEVLASVRGLEPGKHAVHVHEVGACTPCAAAGSHLDLGPFGQNVPVTANHPYHSGDLVNLRVGSDGRGSLLTTSSRIALSPGNLSVFDEDGSAIIVHGLADQYCPDPTDPNCAGGPRVACGIIRPVE
jgi:Cu-Zn family superoxide dismutase